MPIKYRRLGSRTWEDAVLLKPYGDLGSRGSWAYVLRWEAPEGDYQEVIVPWERVRIIQ
jgi:hypothetical protein